MSNRNCDMISFWTITCYHASGFVQNGSFPWIRTTISGSRDRRNAIIRGRNTMPCERMLPYVHMARNSFYPHLMVDGIRSGRRIRTAIREYESRVIPNFTTPASGMAGNRTPWRDYSPAFPMSTSFLFVSCFHARNMHSTRRWPLSRRPHAMQHCV